MALVRVKMLLSVITAALHASNVALSLSDLRVGATATKKVVLPLAGRPSPALFHLQVTYRLLASARGGEGAGL